MEKMVINANFWQSKKVLITGHTGFKGSWLSLWLKSMGADVIGYALEPHTSPCLFELTDIAEGMTSLVGDVRDLEHLKQVLTQYQPEIVIHMAAQALVRYSYSNPVETFTTNVMGTVNLLEAVRGCNSVKAVVNVTSDKCYENQEWQWGYREHEPMGGFDPYSNSKGCSELVTSSYRNSFFNTEHYDKHGVAIASARAGNVIGGGDWSDDRLIPDIIKAIINGQDVIIRNPNAIRPWQHVLEPLSGYLTLAQRLYEDGTSFAEAWNFGPDDNDAKPVQWIVETLTNQWGQAAGWKLDSNQHLHEAHYLKLDCSKAKTYLHWRPRWQLEQTLEEIVEWYQGYINGQNLQQLSLNQIKKYNNL